MASEPSGRPVFALSGETAATVAARGIAAVHLSLSHDAGLATAYVVAETADAGAAAGRGTGTGSGVGTARGGDSRGGVASEEQA